MSGFAPLPQPRTDEGAPRRVGVEIELGGLSEGEVARLCAQVLGGRIEQRDSHVWRVSGTEIGDIEVYLDIFLRDAQKSRLRDLALDLGREVVPVEIVTEPLDMDALARLVGEAPMKVNALHSQAVDRLGEGLRVAARDQGGMIQAIERMEEPFALGVQWHPEHLFYAHRQMGIFRALVAAARACRESRAQLPGVDAEAP